MTPQQWLLASPLIILLVLSTLLSTGMFNNVYTEGKSIGKTIRPFRINIVGKPPTEFMTEDVWKGRVAVINVFASWCVPCQAEHGVVLRLAKTGKAPVYGIAWRDTDINVIKWLQAKGNPYQMIGNDKYGMTTVTFSLSGVPETLVVGKDGTVYYHYVSVLTDDEVDHVILPLIDYLNSI
jgi:cytochrome c biogenesis protein CcmG, thiol:disulfide interchange protein DsbE